MVKPKYKYIAINPQGGKFKVECIKTFCEQRELSVDGFSKCINGKRNTFSGGWTARLATDDDTKHEENNIKEPIPAVITTHLHQGDIWYSADEILRYFGYVSHNKKVKRLYCESVVSKIKPYIYVNKFKFWNRTAIYGLRSVILDSYGGRKFSLEDWDDFIKIVEKSTNSLVLSEKEEKAFKNPVIDKLKTNLDETKQTNLEIKVELLQEVNKNKDLTNQLNTKYVITYQKGMLQKHSYKDVVSLVELPDTIKKLLKEKYEVVGIE